MFFLKRTVLENMWIETGWLFIQSIFNELSVEWRDSCLTFKIPLAFKFSDSNFLFKTLIVQNGGHNLDSLESISLFGPFLCTPCALSGCRNEYCLQGCDAFRIYNAWKKLHSLPWLSVFRCRGRGVLWFSFFLLLSLRTMVAWCWMTCL